MSKDFPDQKFDVESVKEELRSEFKLYVREYVTDVFDDMLSPSAEDQSDTAGEADLDDDVESDEPEKDEPGNFPLTLRFRNNNGSYTVAENPNTGEIRSYGEVSEPDSQGNVSVTVFSKIFGDLEEKPSYYRITYSLVE